MSTPLVPANREIVFPPDFKFGVADADLQVIGEDHTIAEEGSEPTMWMDFTRKQGIETPGPGVDRYHRWQEDIEQLERLGVRDYRTSVSMARTLKQNGEVNGKAIDWYKRYFGALKERGISVYATLYHWELPQYANSTGGWTNREAATLLEKHAGVVAEHLGEYISEYFILNEPWCSTMLSYYEGRHAPGKQYGSDAENLKAAILASYHILLGQRLAYRAITERVPSAKVSTVLNFEPAYATSSSPGDVQAARLRDGYYNRWFLDPIFTGQFPEQMVELYGKSAMPSGYRENMSVIKIGDKLNALGINYYRGSLYRAGGGDLKSEEVQIEGAPTNGLGWPVYEPPLYPEGMYDILQQVYFGYRAFGLEKIYITENGMALETPWDGHSETVDDEPRVHYLRENLRQVHKALLHGIPVEGYFAWTLMDNFEWAEGYRPNSAFGLIHVDKDSLTRTWKKSAAWYSALAKTHSLL